MCWPFRMMTLYFPLALLHVKRDFLPNKVLPERFFCNVFRCLPNISNKFVCGRKVNFFDDSVWVCVCVCVCVWLDIFGLKNGNTLVARDQLSSNKWALGDCHMKIRWLRQTSLADSTHCEFYISSNLPELFIMPLPFAYKLSAPSLERWDHNLLFDPTHILDCFSNVYFCFNPNFFSCSNLAPSHKSKEKWWHCRTDCRTRRENRLFFAIANFPLLDGFLIVSSLVAPFHPHPGALISGLMLKL